jgi:uncharacterized phage infection (PIP) family protein YhgE
VESIFEIILIGFAVVMIYDIIGSLLSRYLGFEYVWWAFGSFIIYGVFTSYIDQNNGLTLALISAFSLGVFDGTVGLLIADKLKATIREKDREVIKINFSLIIQMGIIAVIMGLIAVLAF